MGKDYKQFNFNSKEDYLYVFYNLITQAYQLLLRYEKYQFGLEKDLLLLEEQKAIYINEGIYSEWHDKVLAVSRGLITLFVDDASGGISYVKIRKMLDKTTYKLDSLDVSIQKELDELRDVRNWSYHLPQTNFVAMKEVLYKNVPEDIRKCMTYSFNPIKVSIVEECNIQMVESLYLHNRRRIEVFDKLLGCMITDFEKLLGEKVSIIEIPEKPLELIGDSLAAVQLSMAMNRRKYDGKNETYEKLTFQKPLNNE